MEPSIYCNLNVSKSQQHPTPTIYGEAVALQALIKANLKVMYPLDETEVLTYEDENGQVNVCAVRLPSSLESKSGEGIPEFKILHEGKPGGLDGVNNPQGHTHGRIKASLESLFHRTQELLGAQVRKMTAKDEG